MRKLAVVLFCVFLCQCHEIPKSIKTPNLIGIKKVGCVSLLGDEIAWMNRPTSTFNARETLRPTSGWNLDAVVEATVQEEIKGAGRHEYVPLTYDARMLSHGVYAKIKSFPVWTYDIKNIQLDLKKIGTEQGVDTIILVVKALTEESNMKLSGYGVYSTPYMLTRDTELFVLTRMVVIDVKALAPIGERQLFKLEKISNELWNKDFDHLTEENQQAIRSKVVDVLDDQIVEEMTKLGLVKKARH